MRVEETPAGDASGPECPCAEQNRQQPIDLSEVAGIVRPALPAGGSPLAGLVKSVGPVGLCAMPSSDAEKTLEPLEHMVLIQADPAGQPSAVGTLSPSGIMDGSRTDMFEIVGTADAGYGYCS